MPPSIVQFDNVRKHYQMRLVTAEALRGVSFGIAAGENISIMGQPRLPPQVRELNWTQNLRILPTVKPKRREVGIGEFTNEFIEIKRGLKEGAPGL